MKLSDYRGKVVALYFCRPIQLSQRRDRQAGPRHGIGPRVALRHAKVYRLRYWELRCHSPVVLSIR